MRTLVILIAAAISVTSAEAGKRHYRPYGTYYWVPPGPTYYIEHLTPDERSERVRRWEAYCRPVVGAPDANGIRRYTYVDRRCEQGYAGD